MVANVHVWPPDDSIEHDTEGDDCVCGPTMEAIKRDDGSMGWVVMHHALDGRK